MKKLIPAILMLSTILIGSCNRNSANLGSWSFKSQSYSATINQTGTNYLTSISSLSSTGNNPEISVYFKNALPTAPGSYTVGAGIYPTATNEVGITLNNPSGSMYKIYNSSGHNSSEAVYVSLSGNKLSVSGANIMLVNTQDATDSAFVTFNINQQ